MKEGSIYICDECNFRQEFGLRSPWSEVKEVGWRTYTSKGTWFHSCPSCVSKFADKGRSPNQGGQWKKEEMNPNKAYDVVLSCLEGRGFSRSEAGMLIRKAQACQIES